MTTFALACPRSSAALPLPGGGTKRCLFLAALAIATLSPRRASAYEEQVTIGLLAGYANSSDAPAMAPRHGVATALRIHQGVGDTWSLEYALDYGIFPDEVATAHLALSTFGATYAVDVLTVVPLFGFGVGAASAFRDGDASVDLALYAMLGLDYLVSREWIVGVDARLFVMPIDRLDPFDRFVIQASFVAARVIDLF